MEIISKKIAAAPSGQPTSSKVVGRFAPSPTGDLHFGSLVAALGSWCLARREEGRWLLRIDDLDTPRVVPGSADHIMRSLDLLGLHWDGEPVFQSRHGKSYQEALRSLDGLGLIYSCGCSRKEILASAPHPGEEGPVYAGTCREGLARGKTRRTLRVLTPQEPFVFHDEILGEQLVDLMSQVGDFVLRRADGLFAYQLAVVVDDALAGVNQVVRGSDLLGSTGRQIWLYRLLGWPVPRYLHLPLVLADNGEKMSKRHGEMSLDSLSGNDLLHAFKVLGQNVPHELLGAPPEEILEIMLPRFRPESIPHTPQAAVS